MSNADRNTPIQASALRKGQHVILKERPCKITDMSTSKTGKHGHAKVHFIGVDVFTGKKYEDICPSTHTMLQPVLVQSRFDLLDIDEDGYTSLMSETGETREDLMIPETDVGKQLRTAFDEAEDDLVVTVLSWGDEELIISFQKQK
jgi:translation initiation factor 5A